MTNTGKHTKEVFELFSDWYKPVQNSGQTYSNAFVLSSANRSGKVSSRVVLLKDYDENGFVFYTNYLSRKGQQLSENPMASMLFYWPGRQRQIKIEGRIQKVTAEESDNYFDNRVNGHKINALVSEQSKPIDSMVRYRLKMNTAIEQYSKTKPKRPEHWGGFRLTPDRFEFWEEGENRFHKRMEYLLDNKEWMLRQLQP